MPSGVCVPSSRPDGETTCSSLPVETSQTEQLSLSSFTFDPQTREFVAVGEYYKLDDKPFVNKSQGFYIKRFSEAGKPVSSKNYGWQREVMALIREIAREFHVPVLCNIHDVDLACEFCTRVIGLQDGMKKFEGTPAELDKAALRDIYAMEVL